MTLAGPLAAIARDAPVRAAFRTFRPITLRWSDNDLYGHVNNVRYYSFFDSAVNGWLIEEGLLDLERGRTVCVVAETGCRFFAPLAFPGVVEAGLAVERIGTTSITWVIGIFGAGLPRAAAVGRFVHVHVDRVTQRPVPLDDRFREHLGPLLA